MELSTSSVSVVMLLLSAFVHYGSAKKPERIVPRIVPSKLQLFEYNNLTVNCEGFFSHLTKWRVWRKIPKRPGNTISCNRQKETLGPCHIMVYHADSGEYWCESKDQWWRSERVFINVTVGNVVLESPVRPVMVGDNVTLRCIEKETKTPPSTEFFFYKDGIKINTSPNGEMTIHNISESDQGKYNCSTSDNEFSGENLLKVKAVLLQSPDRPVMKGTNVTLFCRDKMAAPNHTSVFYKDGQIIGNSSSGQMTITVSKFDEGVYKCRSSEGRESEEQWLAVSDGDVILESPVRPVIVGDNVTLRCIKRKSKTSSTEFFFYKDGVKINSSSVGEMTIHNISESDQGRYKCSTSDEFSEENLLQVKAVLQQSPDRPVVLGTNVTLFCRDKMAAPNHTSVFYKDGQIIGNSSSGELTLKVSKSDEGVYKCRSSEGRESEEQWLAVRESVLDTQPERSIPIDRDDLITVIVSVVIGLGVLPLLLTFLVLNKVDVSDESVKETVIFQVTKIRDDEKREHSRVSRRGRGSAQVDTKYDTK